jgi:GDP-4-dehydro-6-deoxy-D-mannose reductase
MRVLVTGATGFVGQNLLRLLVSRRHEVFGTFLHRDFAGSPAQVKLFRCDLRQPDRVQRVVREVRPHQVYHLAALSSVRDSFQDSKKVYEANFFGTLNLLDAIRKDQPSARVLLVGSSQCYGRVKPSQLPIAEKQPLTPNNPYGVSKAAADMLGGQFFLNYRLHIVRARPFNHTGPGQSPDFVCSDFARQFASAELGLRPAVVQVGNLEALRDFSDVRDVVRAYALLMRKGRAGEAYNVASGRAVSLRKIISILSSLCPRQVQIEIERRRLRRGETDVVFGSNRKLKQATGWRPRLDLATTLRDLYFYWRDALQSESRLPKISTALPQSSDCEAADRAE